MKTLNCKGKLIDLSVPKVMGILNITPDSFYDGGNTTDLKAILNQTEKFLNEGATFIDVGGYSSRPGADDVSESVELKRLIPAIEAIIKKFPETIISIDTFRASVAKASIESGAAIVNDISGGNLDSSMHSLVSKLKVPYIMMHMRGTPQTMATQTNYENITLEVLKYFSEKLAHVRALGLNDVVVDPGFGFAKTRHQCFELLNNLELFKQLEVPYLVGVSRKSMIYKTLETSALEALNGTTALHSIALLKGASILRVHDVKEAIECVTLLQNLNCEH